jgi:hypothetical protein
LVSRANNNLQSSRKSPRRDETRTSRVNGAAQVRDGSFRAQGVVAQLQLSWRSDSKPSYNLIFTESRPQISKVDGRSAKSTRVADIWRKVSERWCSCDQALFRQAESRGTSTRHCKDLGQNVRSPCCWRIAASGCSTGSRACVQLGRVEREPGIASALPAQRLTTQFSLDTFTNPFGYPRPYAASGDRQGAVCAPPTAMVR